MNINCQNNTSKSVVTPRTTRSRTTIFQADNLQNDLKQSSEAPREVLVHGRRSNNGTAVSLRQIPRTHWYFGFNRAGKKDKRIIVIDGLGSRQYAREYAVYSNSIRCLGCNRVDQSHNHGRLDFDNQLLYVTTDHVCEPRLHSEIKEEQKLFASKCTEQHDEDGNEPRSSSSRRAQIDDDESMGQEPVAFANTTNTSAANNYNNFPVFGQPPSAPSTVNSQQLQPAAVLSNLLSVQSVPPTNEHLSSIQFYPPSGFFLYQCCEKLDLTYSSGTFALWTNIKVDDFNLTSISQNVYPISNGEMSGFSAISLLLTGSESSAMKIKCNLSTYILQNCDTIGEMVGCDLSKSNNPKLLETFSAYDLTEIHFVAMSRLFNCRFAIFKDDGSCKCYGNWNQSDEYIPIFLLELKNGKYSPIMSF